MRLSFGRRRQGEELEREIRDHLELEAAEQQDTGLTAEEARDAARRLFGNATLIAEDIRGLRGRSWLDALGQDVRYAARLMKRAPGFAVIAAGSAALGIGACAVMFALLNFAVFQRLPVEQPARLLSISEKYPEIGNQLSYPDFVDLRGAQAFQGVAGHCPLLVASIDVAGEAQRHWGALVTANYFAVVRPRFVLGRGFNEDRDDGMGEARVVVVSHEFWRTRLQADPEAVGRTILVNGRGATIVGVTDRQFRGAVAAFSSEFWIPFSMRDEMEARLGTLTENRQRFWLDAVARLRDGSSAQQAQAQVDVIAQRLNSVAGSARARGFQLEQAGHLNPQLRQLTGPAFAILLAVAVLVLVAACANVANLLVWRASARRAEIAARLALGASRSRIVRQLLTESLGLALIGGVGGFLLARYAVVAIERLRIPLNFPWDLAIALDYRVVFFCVILSILTGVAFGLLPALRATQVDVASHLKTHARSHTSADRFRVRNGLVVIQVATCALLLLSTGLFLRSLNATRAMDVGLTKENLLLLAFDPSLDRRSNDQARELLRELLERVQADGSVESATLTTRVPLTLVGDASRFVPEGAGPEQERVRTQIYAVGPRFFETFGIPVLAGEMGRSDSANAERTAVVNEAFAHAAFPGQSPIGRWIVGDGKRLRVVGVVATAKSRTIGEPPTPALYLPIFREYTGALSVVGVTLAVKGKAVSTPSPERIRAAIHQAAPALAIFDIRTIESHLADAVVLPRVAATFSTIAGLVALTLSAIGVYGVISFAVARRRREIGIRVAIGASPNEVLRMILNQGVVLAAAGTGIGMLAAGGVTRFAASLLYGVDPLDPATFIAAPVVLMLVATVACLLPARRAARVDPVEILRSE